MRSNSDHFTQMNQHLKRWNAGPDDEYNANETWRLSTFSCTITIKTSAVTIPVTCTQLSSGVLTNIPVFQVSTSKVKSPHFLACVMSTPIPALRAIRSMSLLSIDDSVQSNEWIELKYADDRTASLTSLPVVFTFAAGRRSRRSSRNRSDIRLLAKSSLRQYHCRRRSM